MGKINKNIIQQRVCIKVRDDLMNAGTERVKKGLMNVKEVSMPKMTELATRTASYQVMLNELKNKPERKKVI